MKVIIVGLGVQGRKRLAASGDDVVATVDPVAQGADYRSLDDVPNEEYEAAFVCTPNDPKVELLRKLFDLGKNVLVEKPLLSDDADALTDLVNRRRRAGVVCYTAYNHRFEPNVVRLKRAVDTGILGRLYFSRLSYGNGTARRVRESVWRDQGSGVLGDLGCHLLDMALMLFGTIDTTYKIWQAARFENRSLDHVIFGTEGEPAVEMSVSWLNWRNVFSIDVYGEKGSAHINSLCKWGRSTYTLRKRILPSGKPVEESVTITDPDPTWALELAHFKKLCQKGSAGNIENDLAIDGVLRRLAEQAKVVGKT